MKAREYWLDYLRAFGCILVTIGHLLMSFQESAIIQDGLGVETFISLIYCFHVYIFFFCSGYLFQSNKTKITQSTNLHLYRIEKCINFLILYVIFSGITYVLKSVFSSDVNSNITYTFLETLVNHPINQMWYLYAISTIFLFVQFINSDKSACIIFGTALLLRVFINLPGLSIKIPLPITYLCKNIIWFVIGQLFSYKQITLKKRTSLLLTLLFVVCFASRTIFSLTFSSIDSILTLLGTVASAGITYNLTKHKTAVTGVWKYISKYMLQIYLLHTIFAAGIRAVLFRLGISHILPHLILGLIFSFVIPVICAIVAEQTRFLNVFFFPTKTVKEFLSSKKDHV